MVIIMLFEKKQDETYLTNLEALNELEYKSKFSFLDELQNAVRTDEEFAKYKGYID